MVACAFGIPSLAALSGLARWFLGLRIFHVYAILLYDFGTKPRKKKDNRVSKYYLFFVFLTVVCNIL